MSAKMVYMGLQVSADNDYETYHIKLLRTELTPHLNN